MNYDLHYRFQKVAPCCPDSIDFFEQFFQFFAGNDSFADIRLHHRNRHRRCCAGGRFGCTKVVYFF